MKGVLGVDTSKWQGGDIPWAELKKLGYEFAYVKVSHGASQVTDPRFVENYNAAREAGLYVGGYHWFVPHQDPIEQAHSFVYHLESSGMDPLESVWALPPALDFEQVTDIRGAILINRFLDYMLTVERLTGWKSVIYSGGWYWKQYAENLSHPTIEQRHYWHAEYPSTKRDGVCTREILDTLPEPMHISKPWRVNGVGATIWQFDGDGGCRLPNGVDVDVNVCAIPLLELIADCAPRKPLFLERPSLFDIGTGPDDWRPAFSAATALPDIVPAVGEEK